MVSSRYINILFEIMQLLKPIEAVKKEMCVTSSDFNGLQFRKRYKKFQCRRKCCNNQSISLNQCNNRFKNLE